MAIERLQTNSLLEPKLPDGSSIGKSQDFKTELKNL